MWQPSPAATLGSCCSCLTNSHSPFGTQPAPALGNLSNAR